MSYLLPEEVLTSPLARHMRLGVVTPSYSPAVVFDDALLKAQRSPRITGFANQKAVGSLITLGFNCCWAWGLNARRDGMTHLLILHADIMPEKFDWLDTFIDEFWASDANVLSAIVPIKDARGLTSTAFETPNVWRPRRLTQREAHSLPVTWTADNVLLNDGLMLVDFTKPWVEKICFHIHDKIERNGEGLWQAYVQSEDWDFSRQCHRLGVKQYATRAVDLLHHGNMGFPSKDVWGAEHDPDADPYPDGVLITAPDGTAQRLTFE